MNPIDIITEFYDRGSKACTLLIQHGRQVASKALSIAVKMPYFNPDLNFIQEAAMLHDIGVFMTNSPELGCAHWATSPPPNQERGSGLKLSTKVYKSSHQKIFKFSHHYYM